MPVFSQKIDEFFQSEKDFPNIIPISCNIVKERNKKPVMYYSFLKGVRLIQREAPGEPFCDQIKEGNKIIDVVVTPTCVDNRADMVLTPCDKFGCGIRGLKATCLGAPVAERGIIGGPLRTGTKPVSSRPPCCVCFPEVKLARVTGGTKTNPKITKIYSRTPHSGMPLAIKTGSCGSNERMKDPSMDCKWITQVLPSCELSEFQPTTTARTTTTATTTTGTTTTRQPTRTTPLRCSEIFNEQNNPNFNFKFLENINGQPTILHAPTGKRKFRVLLNHFGTFIPTVDSPVSVKIKDGTNIANYPTIAHLRKPLLYTDEITLQNNNFQLEIRDSSGNLCSNVYDLQVDPNAVKNYNCIRVFEPAVVSFSDANWNLINSIQNLEGNHLSFSLPVGVTDYPDKIQLQIIVEHPDKTISTIDVNPASPPNGDWTEQQSQKGTFRMFTVTLPKLKYESSTIKVVRKDTGGICKIIPLNIPCPQRPTMQFIPSPGGLTIRMENVCRNYDNSVQDTFYQKIRVNRKVMNLQFVETGVNTGVFETKLKYNYKSTQSANIQGLFLTPRAVLTGWTVIPETEIEVVRGEKLIIEVEYFNEVFSEEIIIPIDDSQVESEQQILSGDSIINIPEGVIRDHFGRITGMIVREELPDNCPISVD